MRSTIVSLQPLARQEMLVTSGGMMELPPSLYYGNFEGRIMDAVGDVLRIFTTSSDNSYVCAKVGYCS